QTVWDRDIVPYRMLIPEGLPAILSGHLNFPRITGNAVPASLSAYFKQEILRGRLNFEGIVITDDLYMGGSVQYGESRGWNMAEIVLEAIKIGNDMVMLSETPSLNDEIWQRLSHEFTANPHFRARVKEAVSRILKVKLLYLKADWRVPFSTEASQVYDDIADLKEDPFFQEQAARGVTLIRDHGIPFSGAGKESILLAGQDADFLREGSRQYSGADSFYFDYAPFYSADEQVIRTIRSRIPLYDKLIFNLSNPNSLEVLKNLRDYRDRIIVFSTLTPVYLEEVPWIRSAIAVYGWGIESFEAGFSALRGTIPFKGRLPINITNITTENAEENSTTAARNAEE
ncbi:MAG: glycoside hydrolase family 3 N-terminal domain-containing protein, partial [Salinispira sp.]